MNPFNLYGPQFLLFYFGLFIVTFIVLAVVRRRGELEDVPYSEAPWNDAYRIAFLRGGTNELVRVAVVSLVDRGLLAATDANVQTTNVGQGMAPRKRIERELVEYCLKPREPKELFGGDQFQAAGKEYEDELTRMRLLPDGQTKARRTTLYWSAAVVLLFFSVTKIGVAIMRGRTNVIFLIIMTIVALFLLSAAAFPRLTARGQALVENVRNLFQSLKVRAPQIQPGGASTELVMLAAVFGVGELPAEQFGWVRKLFSPRQLHFDQHVVLRRHRFQLFRQQQ